MANACATDQFDKTCRKVNVLAAWRGENSECNAWHGEHMHNKPIQSKQEDKIVETTRELKQNLHFAGM